MGRRPRISFIGLLLVGLSVGAAWPPTAGAAAPPVLPVGTSDGLLSGLAAPALAPGGSGSISFVLTDTLAGPITSISLTFELYAFAAYPGGTTSGLPAGGSPEFSGMGANGSAVVVPIARLAASGSFGAPGNLSLPFSVPASAPSGTFAIRAELTFQQGAQSFRLASRGYFSSAVWANGTELANGTPTVNASRLGVSGVLPETAILIRSNGTPTVLYGVLGASLALAAAGGYVSYRRGPGSRSRKWTPGDPTSAPKAFGKSRIKDGD